MRKIFIVLLVISVLLSSCVPDIAVSGGVVVSGERAVPTNIESYYKNEDIVYVTKSGSKYHKKGCPYLKSSSIMMSLGQAVMEGKKPCSRCFGGYD